MNNAIYELLRSDSTIYVNRALAKVIGLNEAILYSTLLSKENYYDAREQLDDEGMFYSTAKDLEKSTALTSRQQKLAIDKLTECKLIESKLKGVPAKKWFKINKDTKIIETLIRQGKELDSRFEKKSFEQFPLILAEDESEINVEEVSEKTSTKGEDLSFPNVETSFNETSNQVSTKCRNKDIQNVETSIAETSKQDLTKCRNIIKNKNNKKNTREKDTPLTPDGEGEVTKTIESVYRKGIAGMSAQLRAATDLWLKYKKEKHGERRFYKPLGMESLLTEIKNNVNKYGDEAVISVINQSAANDYTGIVWDWLSRASPKQGDETKPSKSAVTSKLDYEEEFYR